MNAQFLPPPGVAASAASAAMALFADIVRQYIMWGDVEGAAT